MDKGTGLSERAVYDGLRKAVENSLIEEEIDDSDRGRIKKSYSLRMRENAHDDEELQTLQSGVQSLHPPLQDLHPDPQTLQARGASDAPRTEKDTQERHSLERNSSNFEGSHDQVEGTGKRPETTRQPAHPAAALNGSAALTGFQRTSDRGSAAGPASLKDLIARRRQSSGGPRRGRPAGSSEDRERLRPFLEDFARELGDEAPLDLDHHPHAQHLQSRRRATGAVERSALPGPRADPGTHRPDPQDRERRRQTRSGARTRCRTSWPRWSSWWGCGRAPAMRPPSEARPE